jgi:Ser/Thr protein kinase RdoA (MazF antagonist)
LGVEDRHAIDVAVAVARDHGLRITEPVVLRDRLNVLVHLAPAPVVARVAGLIARVRPGADWLRRELAVAAHLARAGAPVVAPSAELPPGPHEREGRVVTFWTHVPATGEPADPRAAGAALRDCHAALRDFHGSLPLLGGITEAEAMLATLAADEQLDALAAARALERIEDTRAVLGSLRAPVQPLHGDAHLGNVLNGPDGPLWNDWEDTCLGPVGWDAACLMAASRVTGEGAERAKAAFAASGIRLDAGELDLWVEARVLQVAIWMAFMAPLRPERRHEPWLQALTATNSPSTRS